MPRILAFIENDIYVRNFVTSGALGALMPDAGFGIYISEAVQKLKGAIPQGKISGLYERSRENISMVWYFNKISMLALRNKSSTLDIKVKAGLMGPYTPDDLLFASASDFNLTREFFIRRMKPNPSVERIVAAERPEVVLFPVTGVEATGAELVFLSPKYKFKTFFLVNGWDNLSSKGVFPLLPDYLGAWGPQSLVDAVDIQGMKPHRVFLMGCARYEDYFKPENRGLQLFSHPYALFAGTTAACDEITPLRMMDEILEEAGSDMKIVYRPHPWREKRKCLDLFEPDKFKHVILDPQVSNEYFGEKQRGTESVSSQNFPELKHYPSLVHRARFVISPMSSMILEAALFDVPALVLAHDDGIHPTPPSLLARYRHFEGTEEVPGWFFARSLDEMRMLFKTILERCKNETPASRQFHPVLSEATRRYLHQDGRSYADRLAEAVKMIQKLGTS